MDGLQIFKYKKNQVRMVNIEDEAWFVAKDVCDILTIANARRIVSDILEKDEVRKTDVVDSLGRKQKMNCVNESGLYTLIMRSNKPEARAFKRWVTHEVLPSIRKHGSYVIPDKQEHLLALAVIEAEKVISEQRKLLEEHREKVAAFDTFLTAHNTQTMNCVAKSLGIGRNRLFALLREKSILMDNNMPYQRYMDYFEVVERVIPVGRDRAIFKPQTFVNARGVEFIRRIIGGVTINKGVRHEQ